MILFCPKFSNLPSQKMQSHLQRKTVVVNGFWQRLHKSDGGGILVTEEAAEL